jgi:hypothetical protein
MIKPIARPGQTATQFAQPMQSPPKAGLPMIESPCIAMLFLGQESAHGLQGISCTQRISGYTFFSSFGRSGCVVCPGLLRRIAAVEVHSSGISIL